jgi:hypothetical protein
MRTALVAVLDYILKRLTRGEPLYLATDKMAGPSQKFWAIASNMRSYQRIRRAPKLVTFRKRLRIGDVKRRHNAALLQRL